MSDLDYVERALSIEDPVEREVRFRSDRHLRSILPEVFRLEEVPQPPDHHPEGDALTHTFLAVRHLPSGADLRLAWAALLHDVGKAETTREIEGRIRAFGHDRKGAEMVRDLLKRLGMGREVSEDIVWLVKHHMFALSWQVEDIERLTPRQWRFIGNSLFPLLLGLMEVDAKASGGNPGKLEQVDFYRGARLLWEEKNLRETLSC